MRKEQLKKVSIIVPVYNVEAYIDQCMESICRQTYTNLEIIVVYDMSADESLQKCQRWDEEDERVILIINQKRNGLGAARNVGLNAATGEYVVYVDSDDWIDSGYIESLYNAIEQTYADYVSSVGFYRVGEGGKISRETFLPAGIYSGEIGKMLVLLREAPAVWKKIYKRKWLINKSLFQPELFHYEDWGFDIALVLQTEKIVLIPPMGVFYRVQRENRLTNDRMEALCSDFEKSIAFGLNKIKQINLKDKYQLVVQKYLLQDFYLRERKAVSSNNKQALQILERIKSEVLIKCFNYHNFDVYKRHICFGSFSLRRIVQRTTIYAKNMEYFGFSSIISAISPGKNRKVKNQNEFRIEQVIKDVCGSFLKVIDSIQEKTVFFFDFLEECNDILELEGEGYITESEAYKDSFIEKIRISNTISSGTDRFISLWKEKCLILVETLNLKKDSIDIMLIKNRMALQYGNLNKTKAFPNIKELEHKNRMISEMEDFFIMECQIRNISVRVFDLPEEYCFTDEQFMYGCEPQYMNEALYTYLGFEIFRKHIEKNSNEKEKEK